MDRTLKTIVVVGAGTAGSIVASRLSQSGQWLVVLVEAGGDRSDEPPADLLVAMGEPGSTWPSLAIAPGADNRFIRGRGVGGSSAINGGLCAVPPLHQFSEWETITDDPYWGPESVHPIFEMLRATTATYPRSAWGRADRALDAAAVGGRAGLRVVDAMLHVDPIRRTRRTFGSQGLRHGRHRSNLVVITGDEVARLAINGQGRVTGVVLANGNEIAADHTVLCAGAVGSPVVLLRSGLTNRFIGKGLRNHVGVAITLQFSETSEPGTPVTCLLGFTSDEIQVLPLNRVGLELHNAAFGGFLLSPLDAVSGDGTVALDTGGEPVISFTPGPDDVAQLQKTLRLATELGREAVARGAARAAFVDSVGTPLETVGEFDDAQRNAWLGDHLTVLHHATGTCRMGSTRDPEAVVDPGGLVNGIEGLSVIDASILPTLPAANPSLTIAMVAIKAVDRLAATLGRKGPT